jgi:4-aminobutyrate aminotransferase-like enzyme
MNPDKVACIIIEPIQAEGGDNHFRDEFLLGLRRICDDNEILLIFDEVQTGIAITGKCGHSSTLQQNRILFLSGKSSGLRSFGQ